jgi:thioredoxin-related protein
MAKSTYVFNDITLYIVIIVILLISIFMLSYYINGNSMLENFAQYKNKGYLIEYFYMKGCYYCDNFDRLGIWDELKQTYRPYIGFYKYDKSTQAGLVGRYRLDGYPTIIISKNGQKVDTYNGRFESKADIEKLIKKYII